MAEGKRLERGFSSFSHRRHSRSGCDNAWIRHSLACTCCCSRLAPPQLPAHARRRGSARVIRGGVGAVNTSLHAPRTGEPATAIYPQLPIAALASFRRFPSLFEMPAPHAECSSANSTCRLLVPRRTLAATHTGISDGPSSFWAHVREGGRSGKGDRSWLPSLRSRRLGPPTRRSCSFAWRACALSYCFNRLASLSLARARCALPSALA